MAKYRRKVTETEAEQYLGEIVSGICLKEDCVVPFHHVHTAHNNQIVKVELGDYIIPEPNGVNYYPCKQDIFEQTYELI